MAIDIPPGALGQPVEVGAITKELKKLWEADEASTNASLMNFLVYTEKPSELLKNSESIVSLTQEHACRAVLIGMDREATEANVQAWITAHCHLAHGKKSICSEQISFLLSGRMVGRLRNTAFAHLNSDLPLVFWWQGEFSDLFEERLYRLLDRLIFDSSSWDDPVAGFEKITAAREDTRTHMVTQDLAWTRSFHYRLAIAGLFDDPAAQKAFPQINKVTIKAQSQQKTSALFLLAWVAELSGWRSTDGLNFESKDGVAIETVLEWDESGAPIGELCLEAPELTVWVSREANSRHLCQSLCVGDHCVNVSGPADSDEPADLVASQLSRGGKNSLFLRVLPRFLELLNI